MVKRLLLISLVGLIFAGCASGKGPRWRAQEFSRAVADRQADQAAAMLDEGAARIDGATLAEALAKGRVGDFPFAADWDRAEATATVRAGKDVFLLARSGEEWKIRCATIGPYHDRTPEMTVLLARHLIAKGDFDAIQSLVPADVEQSPVSPPASLVQELRQWDAELAPYACAPFSVVGDVAELRYGPAGDKTVRLVREGESWRIRDLW
ncbi:MAG: hypothetical protein C4523_11475 [Myxococcales bacterium]|nr:MAG: hypothetical protein C4523_11475 [Myxococcales bacterium]